MKDNQRWMWGLPFSKQWTPKNVFNIVSRPQLIEAPRSLISEFEDGFVLLGVGPSSNCRGRRWRRCWQFLSLQKGTLIDLVMCNYLQHFKGVVVWNSINPNYFWGDLRDLTWLATTHILDSINFYFSPVKERQVFAHSLQYISCLVCCGGDYLACLRFKQCLCYKLVKWFYLWAGVWLSVHN